MIPFLEKKLSGVKSVEKRTREFDYSKGLCSLKFSLRVDTKTELIDFLSILKVAIDDVEIELSNK